MSNTNDVLTGIATMISAAGLAKFNPSAVYATTDTGILMKIMADGSLVPDRLIVLNAFVLTSDVSLPQDRWLLQIAYRGQRNRPLDVDDIADPVQVLLHGAKAVPLGSSTADQILFSTSAPMGEDALTRSIRADKFFIDLAVPPTSLRPDGGSWV